MGVTGSVSFFAAGRPQTKGSTRSLLNKQGKLVTMAANPRTKAWQGVVAHAAHLAGARLTYDGVRLSVVFAFARPAGHYGSGRNADKVKASAPSVPTTRSVGDLDKLVRAVLDGLTGIAYADDSQVVSVSASKVWAPPGEAEGASVTLRSAK